MKLSGTLQSLLRATPLSTTDPLLPPRRDFSVYNKDRQSGSQTIGSLPRSLSKTKHVVGTKVLAEKRFRAMLGAQQSVDTECRDMDVGCQKWNDLERSCYERSVAPHPVEICLSSRPGAQKDGDDYDDWQVVPVVRAWRAWAMVSFFIALSLGSWLWHVSSNARTDTDALPVLVVPAELGFREMLLFMVYGFVERGLEHQGGFTTMVFCMMFCIIVILSYFCWKAQRTEKERASELVELQKLCDALWAEQKSDKERMRQLAQEATVLSQENAFFQMRYY